MEKTNINFKQVRDFGEVFNATFAFIGQEFKLLGKAILYFVLPVLVITAILNVLIGIEQQKFLNEFSTMDPSDISNPFSMMGNTYKYAGLMMLVYIVAMTSLICTVYGYIKLYVTKGKDQFTLGDIWQQVAKYFLPVLGTSIVVGIITFIGLIFCLIPGIYLGVSLCLIYMALLYEEKGFGDAFSRSFELTKEKWWLTFGILLIAYILIYIISILLSIPSILMGFKSLFTNFKNPAQPLNLTTGYYIMNSITSLISYILFTIPYVAIAFHFFSLREAKERPSLQEKVDQIS